MTLTAGPLTIQTNWTDTNDWPMWEQPHANYLSGCARDVTIDRWCFRTDLRPSTCTILAHDPDCALRIGKDSPLAPNVQLGRRLRVLGKQGATWYPHFFGYISAIEPTADDPTPINARITAYSPLQALAPVEIALPPSDHPYVYRAADPDHSALVLLLKAINLWGTPFVDIEDVGDVIIDGIWGDDTKTFSAWLGELCGWSDCILTDEPRYATTAGDPDFVLHWYKPPPDAPAAWTWSAAAGDLESGSQIEWNGEHP